MKEKNKLSSIALNAYTSLQVESGILNRGIKSLDSYNTYVSVNWSPLRQYPHLIVGVQDVNDDLSALWASAQSGALVSGSFYLPPPLNHIYSQKKLNLPDERIKTAEPIITTWLTQNVTLKIPEAVKRGDRLWLQPPRSHLKDIKASESEDTLWHDELTTVLEGITQQARGGTLILATSYWTIENLTQRLTDILGDRLIPHTKDIPFDSLVDKYMTSYRKGDRPVLIAVGRAWTGLDIVDNEVKAECDHSISDEVILRIPFRTNRSSTHMARSRRYYFNEHSETALMLKQGMGRLKRREGVPEKNLYILDSRLSANDPKTRTNTRLHRGLMKAYNKHVPLKP
ncbi:MAG: helicase C-terminal domain-containing protein [Methylococcales bacterium]